MGRVPQKLSASRSSCALVVLTYNGKHLLEEYLDSVVTAAASAKQSAVEVIVLDNGSTDGSVSWVEQHCSAARCVTAPGNHYLYSYNWLAGQLPHDFLLFANNDLRMTPDCLDPLFEVFVRYPRAFAASPYLYRPDGVTIDSARRVGEFWRGQLRHGNELCPSAPTPTLFASGGACLLRANDFRQIEGFSTLYSPAYWEDVDLCYRAWAQGRPSVCQPLSVMYHYGSASLAADGPARAAYLNQRNGWLFTWRNVSDPNILLQNVFWTARHALALRRRRQMDGLAVYGAALQRWRFAVRSRKAQPAPRRLGDAAICRLASEATCDELSGLFS